MKWSSCCAPVQDIQTLSMHTVCAAEGRPQVLIPTCKQLELPLARYLTMIQVHLLMPTLVSLRGPMNISYSRKESPPYCITTSSGLICNRYIGKDCYALNFARSKQSSGNGLSFGSHLDIETMAESQDQLKSPEQVAGLSGLLSDKLPCFLAMTQPRLLAAFWQRCSQPSQSGQPTLSW